MNTEQQRTQAKLQIAKGWYQVTSGVATACGKGLLGGFLCNHQLMNAAVRLGQMSIQQGMRSIENGNEQLATIDSIRS